MHMNEPAVLRPDATPASLEIQLSQAFLQAVQFQARGELSMAEPLLRFVLEARPDDLGSLLVLGTICAATNRPAIAKDCFTRTIAIEPNCAEAHGGLGAIHAEAGETEAAETCYERALALAPDHPEILYAFALLLQTLGRNDDAILRLARAIAVRPGHLDSRFTLGNLLYAAGRHGEAAQCYLDVLQINPRHPETHNNLANALLRQGDTKRAIAYYRTAIDIKPDYADAYGNLGNALIELNRLDDSIAQSLKALALKPARFEFFNNLGVAYQALGRFEEATRAFEKAIELSPGEASIHLNLANLMKFKPDDRRLPGLRWLLDHVGSLDEEKRIATHFAMGKALADLQQHDEAFEHLLEANALKRKTFVYDQAERRAICNNVREKFTPAFFDVHAGRGDPSWSPIFIVGMPRSGTTLLEQVLASHSQVFGAGELETFKEAVGPRAAGQDLPAAYPDLVASLTPERIAEIGRTYSAQVRALAPQAPRIVDKMPLNFMFVGLIHLALPKARIIHIRRDPLDTCVSCFSRLFTGNQPFAYDLSELGDYYRSYEDVMAHWNSVLPPDVMIDVQYEALVEDLEGVSRRVLKHCGLAWEDACRDFQNTKRTVRTASLRQVREPLYRTSIGSWRRYQKFLGPLREALDLEPVT
jgi:tetratricopeptide (TPR) repeat protein